MDAIDEGQLLGRAFAWEIHFQALAALRASMRIAQIMSPGAGTEAADQTGLMHSRDEIRVLIEEFLTRCANLNRIFNNPKSALRSAALRSEFRVSEHSAMFNSAVRNAMQHFDERLDRMVQHHREGGENFDQFSTGLGYGSSGLFHVRWHDRDIQEVEVAYMIAELKQLKDLVEEKYRHTKRLL